MPSFQPYWGKPAVRNDRGGSRRRRHHSKPGPRLDPTRLSASFTPSKDVEWAVIHGRLDALSLRHDTKPRAANGILKRRSARRLEPFTMPLPAAQQDRLERIQPRR